MPVPVCVREYVIFLKRTITGVIRAYKRLKESFRESFKESLKRKLYGPTCLRPKDWVQITFRSEILLNMFKNEAGRWLAKGQKNRIW